MIKWIWIIGGGFTISTSAGILGKYYDPYYYAIGLGYAAAGLIYMGIAFYLFRPRQGD